MSRVKLASVTGDDLAAEPVQPGYRQVIPPTTSSAGSIVPKLSDAVQALLIMNGLQAQFVINYWRVTRKKETGPSKDQVLAMRPGQKYREATGASPQASFEEWQSVVKNFVAEPIGTS